MFFSLLLGERDGKRCGTVGRVENRESETETELEPEPEPD